MIFFFKYYYKCFIGHLLPLCCLLLKTSDGQSDPMTSVLISLLFPTTFTVSCPHCPSASAWQD